MLAFLLCLMTVGILPGSGSAQDQQLPPWATWMRQLDHESLARRNQAEDHLVANGSAFLAWLSQQPRTRFLSSEAEFRIQRIRARLFEMEWASVTKASRVQLESGWNAMQCADEFWQQTGNRISIESPTWASPPDEKMDFWVALACIAEHNQLAIEVPANEESTLTLAPKSAASPADPLATQAGPLRMEWFLDSRHPNSLAESSARSSDAPQQVQLKLLWEPRLQLESLRIPMRDLVLSDAAGQPWATYNQDAVYTIPLSGTVQQASIRLPVRGITTSPLHHLSVPVEINVIGPPAICVFSDFLRDRNREPSLHFGMATVTLERVTVNGHRVTVRLSTRYHPQRMTQPLQSHSDWAGYCSASLLPENGPEIAATAEVQIRQESHKYVIEYEFQGADPQIPHDLRFQIPAGILQVQQRLQLTRPQ